MQGDNPDAELEKRVKVLVAEQTGYPLERISFNTRILEDIQCDGDDVAELFEAFAQLRLERPELRLVLTGGGHAGSLACP